MEVSTVRFSSCGITYSLLNVVHGLTSGEVRNLSGGEVRWDGEDIRAVDQSVGVGTELAHSLEDELEAVLELSLVSCRWVDC